MKTPDGKNRKRNTGFGWLVVLIVAVVIYLTENDNRNTHQAAALPTVATNRTTTPAPTGFVFFIPTRAPWLASGSQTQSEPSAAEIARLAQEYPEDELKAALGTVDAVSGITTAMVKAGPSVIAEITVEAGRNSIRTAERLRLALMPMLEEEIVLYVFILDDGQQISEYTYQDGIWTATPL